MSFIDSVSSNNLHFNVCLLELGQSLFVELDIIHRGDFKPFMCGNLPNLFTEDIGHVYGPWNDLFGIKSIDIRLLQIGNELSVLVKMWSEFEFIEGYLPSTNL